MSATTSTSCAQQIPRAGDIVDINLAYMNDLAIRVEFFGDEIDRISEFNPLTGEQAERGDRHVGHLPGQPLYRRAEKMRAGLANIRAEAGRGR